MNKLIKREEGFTIIEVVLVLAIAGLIFLVVFLALPQLQASRRDTQRKSDAGRFLAAVENFAGNHNGIYPDPGVVDVTWAGDNIAGDFNDPSKASPYGYEASQADLEAADPGTIFYSTSASCTTDGSDGFGGGNARDAAVQMKLESGIFCQDNQ